jgi:hypothetical protein
LDEEETVVEIQPTEITCKPARRRKKRQRTRIQTQVKSLLATIPDLVILGKDPLFQSVLDTITKQPPTIVSFQVVAAGVPLMVVGVPDGIWVKPKSMALLIKVKDRMTEMQRDCVLFPQGAIGPDHHRKDMTVLDLFSCDTAVGPYGCSPRDPVGCIKYVVASKTCRQELQ